VKKPLIGIIPALESSKYTLFCNYCEMVERAGGNPVILPYGFDAIRVLHGILFSGGCDLSPETSGCEASPLIRGVTPERDAFESQIFKRAMEAGLPILGICRGHQLINALLGGTIIRDISEAGYTEQHNRGTELGPHPVVTVPGTLLRSLIGDRRQVWSTHHQAVKFPGRGLIINAYSPEGVVEGIEHESGRILGMQTHPERMDMLEPFEWLIGLAAERM